MSWEKGKGGRNWGMTGLDGLGRSSTLGSDFSDTLAISAVEVVSRSNFALLTSANWAGESLRIRRGALVVLAGELAGAERGLGWPERAEGPGVPEALQAAVDFWSSSFLLATSFLVFSLVFTKSSPLATEGPWAKAPMM